MHTMERKGWKVSEEVKAYWSPMTLVPSNGPIINFGRSPRPGKWKNIQALTEEDVKSFKHKQSHVKLTG